MKHLAILSAVLLASPAMPSDIDPGATTQQVYTYALELDAEGHIAGLAPATTYLRVVVDQAAGGDYRVVSATTGPALAAVTAPDYPVRDQVAGNEGMVVLRLEIGEDGRVRGADVHARTGSASRAMAEAASAASREWRFTPEQVDGRAVASTLLWPVCYLGPHSPYTACSWTGPDTLRFSSKTVLPLDPNVTVTWTAAR